MKNLIFSKFSCAVMIGLLMPLSVVKASDVSDVTRTSVGMTADEGPLTNYMTDYQVAENEKQSAVLLVAEGAQGPIRSEMSGDKPHMVAYMTDNQAAENESEANK